MCAFNMSYVAAIQFCYIIYENIQLDAKDMHFHIKRFLFFFKLRVKVLNHEKKVKININQNWNMRNSGILRQIGSSVFIVIFSSILKTYHLS